MNMRISFFLLVLCSYTLVQGQTGAPGALQSQVIKITSNKTDSLNASTIFEKMEFIRLSNDQLIGRISKALIMGNYIYVLDLTQSAILCFDKAGRFINLFSKVGRGPDEYLELNDFDIDPNRGVVFALTNKNRLVELDSKLNLIKTHQGTGGLNSTNILSLDFQTMLYFTPFGVYKEYKKEWESSELVFHDLKNGTIRQDFFNSRTIKIGINPGPSLFRSDSLLKTSFLKYDIYSIYKKGITSVITVDHGSRSFDAKTFDNMKHLGHLEEFLDPDNPMVKGKVTFIKNAYFVNKILFFESVIEGRAHNTFYSFKDKSSYLSMYMRNDLVDEIPFGRVKGASKNCLITVVESSTLVKDLRKQGKTSRYGIDEADNPIICLFYIKR